MLVFARFAFPLFLKAARHDSMMSSVNHQTSLSLCILHTINNAIERERKDQTREASSRLQYQITQYRRISSSQAWTTLFYRKKRSWIQGPITPSVRKKITALPFTTNQNREGFSFKPFTVLPLSTSHCSTSQAIKKRGCLFFVEHYSRVFSISLSLG